MSYEPSTTTTTTGAATRPAGIHLAVTLLALAIAIFLAAQIGNAGQQRKLMNWQITTGDKQLETLKQNQTQLTEYAKQQDTLVKQSTEVQAQYQKLLDDLLKLADEDTDAKSIIEKWKIQRAAGGQAAAGAAAAGAAASAPAAGEPAKPADKK